MKKTSPLTRILAVVLAIMLVGIVPVSAAEDAWKLSENTRIICTMDKTTYSNQVEMFAAELKEKLAMETYLPIVYDDSTAGEAGDIILVLDSANTIPAQGYSIKVENGILKIEASDADGLFYGCRVVIKQLILSGGEVTKEEDSPDVLERAVSLDNGRKYFSVGWIKEFIREMSWANMNTLVLHFSEEMGLGIESKLYPWLNGRDGTLCTQAEVAADNGYLTQEEVVEIVEYAKQYHVEIIPSLDSPGHMNYIVKKFNEQCAEQDFTFSYKGVNYTATAGSEIGNYYHYDNQTSIVKGSRNAAYSRGIDISNEVAVAFTKSLIEEYAKLFAELGCTKFDIGGDELLGWGTAITTSVSKWKQLDHWKDYAIKQTENNNAVAYDAFLLYMNDLNKLVRELGYTSVRMWNDDALRSSDTGWKEVVELNKDIDIWFWTTGSNTVWTYANAGYQVYNILSDYNYYAMTEDYFSKNRSSFTQSYADQIYNEWNPYVFDPDSTILGTGKNTAQGNSNVLGSAFGIWCDNPALKTADEVMSDVLPMIRAHGAKAWDALANSSVVYETFVANWEKLGTAPSETEYVSPLDYNGLNTAIAMANEFITQVDNESYVNPIDENKLDTLIVAVTAGNALAAVSQDDINAAEEEILTAYKNIFAYAEKTKDDGKVDTTDYILSASFVSTRVYIGKVATLNVTVQKGLEISGFDISYVTDDGETKHVPYFRFQKTTNATKTIYRALFNPTEDQIADVREYTIRVIFKDGTVSNDSIVKSLNVRG